jgi:hypothetical protein
MSTWDLKTFVHMKRSPGELYYYYYFFFQLSQSPFHCLFWLQYPTNEHLISISEYSILGKPKCPKTATWALINNKWMVWFHRISGRLGVHTKLAPINMHAYELKVF